VDRWEAVPEDGPALNVVLCRITGRTLGLSSKAWAGFVDALLRDVSSGR
jgi:hypothetical protein